MHMFSSAHTLFALSYYLSGVACKQPDVLLDLAHDTRAVENTQLYCNGDL